jgi:glycine/D-amino acid oxidase-like deaminating enzyme
LRWRVDELAPTTVRRNRKRGGFVVETADVVVIGGGMLGASAALHLREADVGDVLLLERDDLAQATSAAGAGFIGTWAAGAITVHGEDELHIQRYALDFYKKLAGDGYDFGYRANGCLWAAANEEAWSYLAAIVAHQAVADKRVLEPAEIEELTGVVPAAAVVRGVIHPSSGQVSARAATLAVADRFVRGGGRIETRRPVTTVLTGAGKVTGVDTRYGRISTNTVVVAAGAWTNSILRQLGYFAPMAPLVASRVQTEPLSVPKDMPTLFFPGFAFKKSAFLWVREEKGSLLWGTHYEAAPRYSLVDNEMPQRFDQLPLDGIMELQRAGALASQVLPLLARYQSMTVAHGAPCYTTDARGIVGPIPGIEGLHMVGGCNEAGITHGPGWGRVLADYISTGRSELADLDAWCFDRFAESYETEKDVVQNIGAWRTADTNGAATTAPDTKPAPTSVGS